MFYCDIFFLFLNQIIFSEYLKEMSQCDGSFGHPKYMFKLIGKKINNFMFKNCLSQPMDKA